MWAKSDYGAYYKESDVDWYLNNEFIEELPDALKKSIIDSEIVITAKSSMGEAGKESEVITRKFFLLSQEELGLRTEDSLTTVSEGEKLKYFVDENYRWQGSLSNGERCPYWTRTPENWHTCMVITIGHDRMGSGTADVSSGVRPAFCIANDTPIIQRTDIVAGETVYVLDLEDSSEDNTSD